MQYRNTRETTGSVIEVTHALKTKSGRSIKVVLTKMERSMLDEIDFLWHESYAKDVGFSPSRQLKVQVTSDTFREGLVGKLMNLKEIHDAWNEARKEALK